MSFSETFYKEVDAIVHSFPLIPYRKKQYYAGMLVVQEQVMRGTESLLTLAATEHPYFKHHLEGERGHHAWIVDDLRELGLRYHEQKTFPEIAQLVGSQFYHVMVGKSIALMGYLAMMEGYPSSPEQISMLGGLYPRSSKTAERHALLDRDHRAELIAELDKLPEADHACVLANGLASAQLYRDALWRLLTLGEKYGTDIS